MGNESKELFGMTITSLLKILYPILFQLCRSKLRTIACFFQQIVGCLNLNVPSTLPKAHRKNSANYILFWLISALSLNLPSWCGKKARVHSLLPLFTTQWKRVKYHHAASPWKIKLNAFSGDNLNRNLRKYLGGRVLTRNPLLQLLYARKLDLFFFGKSDALFFFSFFFYENELGKT